MRLTLLKAKEALRHRCPEDQLEYRINRCCERLMLNGKFAGAMRVIRLALRYGEAGLPTEYRTIEGFRICDRNYHLANQWYEFLPGLPVACGLIVGCGMAPLRDLGDGNATIYSLPLLGKLSIDYTGSVAQIVTIYGTNADAMPIKLVIADKTQNPDNPFVMIDRIHKEQGPVAVSVTHTDADAVTTRLAMLAPTCEESFYRRYKLDSVATTLAATADVLATRRHVEFTDDEDVIPFSNISALESMMDSLQYRKENDITLADRYENDAVNVLNQELGETNPNSAYPTIRFLHPGGTVKMTSRY